MDMTDVRKALWRAYKKLEIEEKKIIIEKDYCELQYPSFEKTAYNKESYLQPNCILIYSPILFPNGPCHIEKGDEEYKITRFYWQAPDIFKKAVDLINSWAGDLKEE